MLDLTKSDNDLQDLVGETVFHTGFPGTIWVIQRVDTVGGVHFVKAFDHSGGLTVTDLIDMWMHSVTGSSVKLYVNLASAPIVCPPQYATTTNTQTPASQPQTPVQPAFIHPWWGASHTPTPARDSNLCPKCNSEVKERHLFFSTYVGCKC